MNILDILIFTIGGFPGKSFLPSLLTGTVTPQQLIIPMAGFLVSMAALTVWFLKWRLPRYRKGCHSDVDRLVHLETVYHEHAWQRVKTSALKLLSKSSVKDLYYSHHKNLETIDKFIQEDLKKYFSKIRKTRKPVKQTTDTADASGKPLDHQPHPDEVRIDVVPG